MKASREETAEKLATLRRLLARKKGITAQAAIAELGCDRRTFYRWLEELQEQGAKVSRVGLSRPTVYVLQEGASPR